MTRWSAPGPVCPLRVDWRQTQRRHFNTEVTEKGMRLDRQEIGHTRGTVTPAVPEREADLTSLPGLFLTHQPGPYRLVVLLKFSVSSVLKALDLAFG